MEKKIISSKSDAGKTGQLHVKEFKKKIGHTHGIWKFLPGIESEPQLQTMPQLSQKQILNLLKHRGNSMNFFKKSNI